MRIIAGSLKGLQLQEPHGHRTHPMSEKIRGALFNALGDVDGLTLLDAFCGTLAVGIEAISRGVVQVMAIDSDQAAAQCALQNIHRARAEKLITFQQRNIATWSQENPEKTFDIVVADPPYDDIKTTVLEHIATHVTTGGILVYSLPPDAEVALSEAFQLLSEKHYGDAKLLFYRKLQ